MARIDNLGFGCVSLTRHTFLKDAIRILSAAYDNGVKHYDTALLYGNGYSEKILGRFIKNKRNEVTVATKCGLGNYHQPSLNIQLALILNGIKSKFKKLPHYNNIIQPQPIAYRLISLEYVKLSLHTSLKNLKTDYIDYYFLHEALPSFLSPEAFSYLQMQKQKGVIGELGVAAAYVNLSISNDEIKGFEVLQYESGPNYNSDELAAKFPGKKHFHHSVLRSLPYLKSDYSSSEMAGIILSRDCKNNPLGKVLFSTTSINKLNENLKFFSQFSSMPLDKLNKVYSALH